MSLIRWSLLFFCLVGCRDSSVPLSTVTKAYQVRVESGLYNVYVCELNGKYYYVTQVHNGIAIGPEVEKVPEVEKK